MTVRGEGLRAEDGYLDSPREKTSRDPFSHYSFGNSDFVCKSQTSVVVAKGVTCITQPCYQTSLQRIKVTPEGERLLRERGSRFISSTIFALCVMSTQWV